MNKTSKSNIMFAISAVILIAASVMGAIYILTGNKIDFLNKTYYVGHIINSDNSINTSDKPEILALMSFLVSIVGVAFFVFGLLMFGKGQSRIEAKAKAKEFIIFQIGLMIVFIALIVLMVIAPKKTWVGDDFHGVTIYYIVLAVLLVGAIIIIIGLITGFKASSKSIMDHAYEELDNSNSNSKNNPSTKKDEF